MPGCTADFDKRTVTFTQSWLKTFLMCPERARREINDPTSSNSDATARGHAVHRYMETRLRGGSRADSLGAAMARLDHLTRLPDFQWIQVKRQVTLDRHVTNLCVAFEAHVLPQVPPNGAVEASMTMPVGTLHGWEVHLAGTPDYLVRNVLWDWKSSARIWDKYETVNWDIQSSAYTWLASVTGERPVNDFTFVVGVVPHGDLQIIDLRRESGDWLWLKRQMAQAVSLMEVMPNREWPTNHQHWLCSARWCPHWDTCRGPYTPSETEGSQEEKHR